MIVLGFFVSLFYLLSLFTVPAVDFLVKIQEVKAMEREDAVFECVLSNPFSKILWFGKNLPLEQGDKYDIEVSEDKLIHRLVVKDCMVVDKGIYSACAGIKSCNAWLIVEGRTLDDAPTKNSQQKEMTITAVMVHRKNNEKPQVTPNASSRSDMPHLTHCMALFPSNVQFS